MGSPEQDPRSLSPQLPAVRVSAVMAGMEWLDPNGDARLAADDVVLVELMDTGRGQPLAVLTQSADGAMALAQTIQSAAIQLLNQEVGNDGKKIGVMDRINRINNAYKETR